MMSEGNEVVKRAECKKRGVSRASDLLTFLTPLTLSTSHLCPCIVPKLVATVPCKKSFPRLTDMCIVV